MLADDLKLSLQHCSKRAVS